AHTWDDIVQMVADAVKTAKPGQWIQGSGWHQAKWDHAPEPNVDGLPFNDTLSRVSPDNPVILTHASGHAIFVNQKAMELAGIGPATPNPPGGEIVRDAKGRAIGMLRDRAMGLVRRVLQAQLDKRTPAQVEADLEETVRLAAHDMLSKGVTTVSDEGESFQTIDFLKKLVGEGKVPARLWVLVSGESPAALAANLPKYWLDGYGDDHLSVRGIGEITADGALGTQTAWFLQPYDDLPTSTGLSVTPPATIEEMAEIALKDHFQVSVHAIGDRANHEVLNVFQQIFAAHPEARDLRWRIEHAQHLEASDIPRFGEMHVIASMQSLHACSDGPYVIQRIGEARAAAGAYAWRKLIDSGAIIANGTDAPVEDINPIPNFACAVTRRMNNGRTFFPQEDMTREEALRSYTINAAYTIFQEHRLGSITPGKLADLVVLSKDIMTIPADQIPTAQVDYTLVGGKIVYQRRP
ncbi:MAG: amidohydrolase, partial [Acidobacteriota bacterium]|nr:amidohydrolase [Acidobacteriota bacterium]